MMNDVRANKSDKYLPVRAVTKVNLPVSTDNNLSIKQAKSNFDIYFKIKMSAEQARDELQQISPVVNIIRVFGILTCGLGAAEVRNFSCV